MSLYYCINNVIATMNYSIERKGQVSLAELSIGQLREEVDGQVKNLRKLIVGLNYNLNYYKGRFNKFASALRSALDLSIEQKQLNRDDANAILRALDVPAAPQNNTSKVERKDDGPDISQFGLQ